MSEFKLFEDHYGETESSFRDRYGNDVHDKVVQCCSNLDEPGCCQNDCHFLVADGVKNAEDDGFLPAFGLDCDVSVRCWDSSDVDDPGVKILCFCRECAKAAHKFDLERERQEEPAFHRDLTDEARRVDELKRKQRTSLEYWNTLTAAGFEKGCAELFCDLGFEAELTPTTNDGGIDIRLEKSGKHGAAQCKAWGHPCGVKQVREFYGAMCAQQLTFGYFISKSGFTDKASILLAQIKTIQGWDVNDLVR